MRMKASISSIHGALRLRDLRRLFRETGGWPDDCLLVPETGMNDRIIVIEEDRHREKDT